jgi:UDP-N-acetylmuramoyl-L-alanyl-D-glutamate--2,6-diaminopimelate ligase
MMAAHPVDQGLLLSVLLSGWVDSAPVDDCRVTGLTLDSRRVSPGALFLACSGGSSHGLDHLEQAIEQGALAIACELDDNWPRERIEKRAQGLSIPLIVVEQLGQRVSAIADRFYHQPSQSLSVIGVTGTNGKTSTTHYIAQALAPDVRCGLIGTVGNGLPGALDTATHTTPDPVGLQQLMHGFRRQGVGAVAMEVSSHALHQGRAAAINFSIAVLTNLTQDHLDYHGTMEAYGEAKRQLFAMPGLKCAVINLDDPYGRELATDLGQDVHRIGYGFDASAGGAVEQWLRVVSIELTVSGMRIEINGSWGRGSLVTPLLGRFNAHNLLAVLAVLLFNQIPFASALERLARLHNVEGRMERFGGGDQPLVVVDYAHTPDALEQALGALREHVGGRLICVFGCGGDRDRGKRPLMGAIAERLADRVIVTDDNPRSEAGDQIVQQILAGMERPDAARVLRRRAEAIGQAVAQAAPGDLVLVAGKGHETYQLVGDLTLDFSDRDEVLKALSEGAA